MKNTIQNLIETKFFQHFITFLIVFNGITLGLETSKDVYYINPERYHHKQYLLDGLFHDPMRSDHQYRIYSGDHDHKLWP